MFVCWQVYKKILSSVWLINLALWDLSSHLLNTIIFWNNAHHLFVLKIELLTLCFVLFCFVFQFIRRVIPSVQILSTQPTVPGSRNENLKAWPLCQEACHLSHIMMLLCSARCFPAYSGVRDWHGREELPRSVSRSHRMWPNEWSWEADPTGGWVKMSSIHSGTSKSGAGTMRAKWLKWAYEISLRLAPKKTLKSL